MVKKSHAKVLDSVGMSQKLLDIDLEFQEFQDEDEQTITFLSAFEGNGYWPRCIVVVLVGGVLLLLAFLIWFGIQHSS